MSIEAVIDDILENFIAVAGAGDKKSGYLQF